MKVSLTRHERVETVARKIPSGELASLKPGQFQYAWVDFDGNPRWQWVLYPPEGTVGVLGPAHKVHQDKQTFKISVQPSILQPGIWHGWLRDSKWIRSRQEGQLPRLVNTTLPPNLFVMDQQWFLPILIKGNIVSVETWRCLKHPNGEVVGVYGSTTEESWVMLDADKLYQESENA